MANTLTKQKLKLAKEIFKILTSNTFKFNNWDILLTISYVNNNNVMTDKDTWIDPRNLPKDLNYNITVKYKDSSYDELPVLELMSQSLSDLTHIKLYIDT